MIVRIKRLLHGYASVRDYQVKEAYKNGEDLTIICGQKIMVVPHSEIMSGSISPRKYEIVRGFEDYYLIDFPWKPQEQQTSLIDLL